MMADAGDEAYLLGTELDKEMVQGSDLADAVHTFLLCIQTMFCTSECLHMGYTKFMLEELQHPRAIICGGNQWVLGGGPVPHDTINRCLARLRNWTTLAAHVVRAEIPEFEAIYALHGFRLAERRLTAAQLATVADARVTAAEQAECCDSITTFCESEQRGLDAAVAYHPAGRGATLPH